MQVRVIVRPDPNNRDHIWRVAYEPSVLRTACLSGERHVLAECSVSLPCGPALDYSLEHIRDHVCRMLGDDRFVIFRRPVQRRLVSADYAVDKSRFDTMASVRKRRVSGRKLQWRDLHCSKGHRWICLDILK